MSQVEFGGSLFSSLATAAKAWAGTALPDLLVVDPSESAAKVAEELEGFWWAESAKVGQGAPEDVEEAVWREACRAALVERIESARPLKP
jgi:hypothetical protein